MLAAGLAKITPRKSTLPASFSDQPSPLADLEHPFALSLSIKSWSHSEELAGVTAPSTPHAGNSFQCVDIALFSADRRRTIQ
jgi:hypothetical protein